MVDRRKKLYIALLAGTVLIIVLSVIVYRIGSMKAAKSRAADYFAKLPDNAPEGDPLAAIDTDFTADAELFESNLPLVVIHLNEELAEYKGYHNGEEIIYEDAERWTTGTIALYDLQNGRARLNSAPSLTSNISIKKRGHTSYYFDKSQYYIKLVDENLEENPQDVFGMGADDAWILNGSMADKSMLRNYLAYRISAQILEYSPRCCYCEMFTEEQGVYTYQGVYLMMESIKQSPNRVAIEESKTKNVYTGYLVRRDRFSHFDTMLCTYGRTSGLDEEWIGLKYPTVAKQTKENLAYIEEDFSAIEKVLYSKDPNVLKRYPEVIDAKSFADYFIINEFFGNYDAGLHSTYMYKNSGEKLKIGPVWDFDQAMNNSMVDEADPYSLAMQEKAFYKQLFADTEFLRLIKERYADYRASFLSNENVFGIIDETVRYLSAAQKREWYRWAADYEVKNPSGSGKYKLKPYLKEGMLIDRMNTVYEQELYTIRTYLRIHGDVIQKELSAFEEDCKITSGIRGEMVILLFVTCILFLIPSVLINRK